MKLLLTAVNVGLVIFMLWFNSCHGSFAGNLEQIVNLLHAFTSSAFYP